MKATKLLIIKSLKKRKQQYILLSATFFLSTLLFTVAVNLLVMAERPFEDNFEALHASHLLLHFGADYESYQDIRDWYKKQPEVIRVSKPIPYILHDGSLYANSEQIRFTAYLTEYIHHNRQDSLVVLNPQAGSVPDFDELWLPYHFSTQYGLEVGDTLPLQIGSGSQNFVISSFIIDPHFLSGLFNPTRIFMAPGALAIYQPIEKISNIQVGVQMRHPSDAGIVYSRFLSDVGFSGTKLEYQLFKSAFSGIFSLFSMVLLFLSLMIFVVAILIMSGTLASQIYADYKQIGIIKTLGFTPADVRYIYLLKMSILCLFSIPLALIAAGLSLQLIIYYMNVSSGLSFDLTTSLMSHILPGMLILSIIMIVTYLTTYRAGNINPIEAIQRGIVSGSVPPNWVKFKKLSPQMMIGLRLLIVKPLSSFLLFFNFAMLTYLILFVTGVANSLEQIKTNRSEWGFLDIDLKISLDKGVFMPLDKKDFLTLFALFQDDTREIIPFSYANLKVITDSTTLEVRGMIYDIPIQHTGFQNLVGNHPKEKDEISLCVNTAKTLNVHLDDTIHVFLEGTHINLQVCGIYQDISAFGEGFRLLQSTMDQINPIFEVDQFGILLSKGVNITKLKNDIISFYGEKVAVEESIDQRAAFLSILGNIRMGIILITFSSS